MSRYLEIIEEKLGPAAPPAEGRPASRADLAAFESRGLVLVVNSRLLGRTVYVVSSERSVPALVGDGVTRGDIWTARELAAMVDAGATPEDAAAVARVKAAFDGEVRK